jgi:ATP-dependent RNA helicase DDX49/DBP8
MEVLRDNLIAKIDSVIAGLQHEQRNKADTQLQIEAKVVGPDGVNSRKRKQANTFVIGTLDIGTWKSPVQSPSASSNITERRIVGLPEQYPDAAALGQDSPPSSISHSLEATANQGHSRRKTVGGLRVGFNVTPPRTPSPPGTRQLAPDQRTFPKRRRIEEGPAKLVPSTIDKLIEGIWEQIHKPHSLVMPEDISRAFQDSTNPGSLDFANVTRRCRVLTGVSRTSRSIEVMMQAHWVDCYHHRIDARKEQRPDLRPLEYKKLVMAEACATFEWSEKDLRNRMAIWKGYQEIKDAAGWAALIFAGPGIYRFCKYRLGFDQDALYKWQRLKSRLEVAADTIQPQWRQALTFVGVTNQVCYNGHPHDWVVGKRKDPVPLRWTYRQWDPHFSFEHIQTSVVDTDAFGTYDPRRLASGPHFLCTLCRKPQSEAAEKNECECFADLFGPNAHSLPPVQVFSTEDGRNNGLIACCTFERGAPVGEFVGFVTKGLEDVDVMQCEGAASVTYQIYQGKQGNFTKFINHSCVPNSQFQNFVWLGVQRTVVVSKGLSAGSEVTVDYSDGWWRGLRKTCLCKAGACRFRDR